MLDGAKHGAEFRRCLINMDVEGMRKVWAHVAPHLAEQSPASTLISMHMARCDMATLPERVKEYSRSWLEERGYQNIDGKWIKGEPPATVYADAVGIAVRSKYEDVRTRIHAAMSDALENERAKGTVDPLIQRAAMLKAREKQRFKLRLA